MMKMTLNHGTEQDEHSHANCRRAVVFVHLV